MFLRREINIEVGLLPDVKGQGLHADIVLVKTSKRLSEEKKNLPHLLLFRMNSLATNHGDTHTRAHICCFCGKKTYTHTCILSSSLLSLFRTKGTEGYCRSLR